MNANEVMQATSDLGNPAKAGDAVVRLFEDATGISPRRMALERAANIAQEWENDHPEFYAHEGNRDLMMTHALRGVSDASGVTKRS